MTTLTGTAGNDTLLGTTGTDTLTGAGGDDTLLGNGGDDVAQFGGTYAGYRFGAGHGFLSVRDLDPGDGNDGVDALADIWSLQFADRALSVAPGGILRIDQPGLYASGAEVTGLADGSFVCVWTDTASSDLLLQRFAADGSVLGAAQLIDETTTEHPGQPAITALSDGGFAIVWTRFYRHFSAGDQARGLFAQRFDADGNSTGAAVRIDPFSPDRQNEATICALDDGGFVVAWTASTEGASQQRIRLQRFDADGTTEGGVFGPDEPAAQEFVAHLATLTDGSFVLAWQAGANGVKTQRYAEDGSTLGSVQGVSPNSAIDTQPAIAPLADGGYAVAWHAYGSVAGAGHVYVQRFAADGTAGGAVQAADTTGSNSYADPAIVALADGGFVVAWEAQANVLARCFDASGAVRGEVIQPDAYGVDATLAALADGGFVLGWSGYDGVQAQRYRADGSPVLPRLIGTVEADELDIAGGGALRAVGGAGDDVYRIGDAGCEIVEAADGGHDRVFSAVSFTLPENVEELRLTGTRNTEAVGHADDDFLAGNSGGNRLRGLQGSDTLDGGAGADTLDGGAGADLMRGGDGDDVYVVDSAGDRVQEFGTGTDEVRSHFDVTLRAGIENLVLLGDAGTGIGNSEANRMRGNAGDNTLRGGAGNDTLEGGGGSDVAVFGGQREDYRLGFVDGVLTVTDLDPGGGNDGSDQLRQIVRLRFADGDLTLESRGMLPVQVKGDFVEGPTTLALADGTTIALWQRSPPSTWNSELWMQRWNADGTPIGAAKRIAGGADTSVRDSSVAQLADGSLVFTWLSQDESARTRVMVRHYAADGTAQGAAVVVDDDPDLRAGGDSTVFALGDGFLVAWTATDTVTDDTVLMAQRFDAGGARVDASFRVNTLEVSEDGRIEGTALRDGGFVLSWLSDWYAPGGLGIRLQRFAADGARLGEETRLTANQGTAYAPAIAPLEGGGYAVAWTQGDHIMVQRFGADGVALGKAFLANLPSTYDRSHAGLLALANGNLLVSWYADGSGAPDVHTGRIFDSNGKALTREILLPEGTTSVTATADGGFEAAGILYGTLSGQAYDARGKPLWLAVHGGADADRIDVSGEGPMRAAGHGGDDLYVVGPGDVVIEVAGEGRDTIEAAGSFTLPAFCEVLVLAGTGAADGVAGAGAQRIEGNSAANRLDGGAGADTLVGGAGNDVYVVDSAGDSVIEPEAGGFDEVRSAVSYTLGSGLDDLMLTGAGAIDAAGNALANLITGNGSANILSGGAGNDTLIGGGGADVARFAGKLTDYRIEFIPGGVRVTDLDPGDGNEGSDLLSGVPRLRFADTNVSLRVAGTIMVNTDVTTHHLEPVIAVLADGGYVIAWESYYQDGSFGDIYAQRFGADGTRIGGEFLVGTESEGYQRRPSITALDDGGFVIGWHAESSAGYGPWFQRFAADGSAQGNSWNERFLLQNESPHIAPTADGGFAYLWFSDGAQPGWHIARFDADGAALGDAYTPATAGAAMNDYIDFATLPDGGFVVVAALSLVDPGGSEIRVQRFDADGSVRSASTRVDRTPTDFFGSPHVAVLADGGFVVGWTASRDPDTHFADFDLRVQRYDASGARVGGEIRVNTPSFRGVEEVALVALAGGGYVAAWEEVHDTGSWIHLQAFGAKGARIGIEQLVDTGLWDVDSVFLAGLPDGDFVLGWEGVAAVRFALLDGKLVAPVRGDSGNDVLAASGAQPMYAVGGAGDDLYLVGNSGDVTLENAAGGIDSVQSLVDWTLAANVEHLRLLDGEAMAATGNAAANRVTGNARANALSGRGGADTLDGAVGNDTLTGGTGADVFLFDTPLSSTANRDLVTDFTPGSDRIRLDDDVFRAFDAGNSTALKAGQFYAAPGATAAHDLGDRIVYDTASGILYYDPDGIAGQSAVQFAVLGSGTHPVLSADSFVVIG